MQQPRLAPSPTPTPLSSFPRASTIARYALIIGNSHYETEKRLPGCVNDVDLLYDTLTELEATDRWEVYPHKDLTAKQMKEALLRFQNVVKRQPDHKKVAMFVFCGHGASCDKINYFLPTNDTVDRSQWLSAKEVLSSFHQMGTDFNFMLLDCCRTPERRSSSLERFDEKALFNLPDAEAHYIVTACGPGEVSWESRGNGLFSLAFSESIKSAKARNSPYSERFTSVAHRVHDKAVTMGCTQKVQLYGSPIYPFNFISSAPLTEVYPKPPVEKLERVERKDVVGAGTRYDSLFPHKEPCAPVKDPIKPPLPSAFKFTFGAANNNICEKSNIPAKGPTKLVGEWGLASLRYGSDAEAKAQQPAAKKEGWKCACCEEVNHASASICSTCMVPRMN